MSTSETCVVNEDVKDLKLDTSHHQWACETTNIHHINLGRIHMKEPSLPAKQALRPLPHQSYKGSWQGTHHTNMMAGLSKRFVLLTVRLARFVVSTLGHA
jgi:hypothetical protein